MRKKIVSPGHRRELALTMVAAEVEIRTVQELAGHKTIAMTMRYAHLAPEQKRRAGRLLDAEVTAKVTTADFREEGPAVASACGASAARGAEPAHAGNLKICV